MRAHYGETAGDGTEARQLTWSVDVNTAKCPERASEKGQPDEHEPTYWAHRQATGQLAVADPTGRPRTDRRTWLDVPTQWRG